MVQPLEYRLEVFEGPLDLLLHLIRKNKLRIDQIPISCLLEQYLDYISKMQSADMELASEFLSMAAHLVYIKTVSLLPKPQQADKLKQDLQGRLLEYELCKQVAKRLKQRFTGNNVFIRHPQKLERNHQYTLVHASGILLKAYLDAAGKGKRSLPPSKETFSRILKQPSASVKGRIIFVLKKLYSMNKVAYNDFFPSASDRSERVATFLALLELVKAKRICFSESEQYVAMHPAAVSKRAIYQKMHAKPTCVQPVDGENDGISKSVSCCD